MSTSVSTPAEARNGRSRRAHFLDLAVSASSTDTFTPRLKELKNKTALI
jgi:hypothetical protein